MDRLELGSVIFLLKSLKKKVGDAMSTAAHAKDPSANLYSDAFVSMHAAEAYLEAVYRTLTEEEECGKDN